MISNATILSFVISVIFTLILPIVLLIILGVKKKIKGLPLLIGAAAFFISQIVLRIPILNVLSLQEWYINFSGYYIPFVLIISLSAGLFEESARLGGALILKGHRSFKDIISFGLGHALCEVIILVGFTQLNNIILCAIINDNSGTLAATLSPEVIETTIAQFTEVNPYHVYLGILERCSAVIFHIFATVLVFKGVTEKKLRFYVLAILAHTMFNFIGVLLARYAGVTITEVILLITALAGGYYVLKQKSI